MKKAVCFATVIYILLSCITASASIRGEKKNTITTTFLPANYMTYSDGIDTEKLMYGDETEEEKLRENMGLPTVSGFIKQLREEGTTHPTREAYFPDPTPPENHYWWNKLPKGLTYDEHDFKRVQDFMETVADNGKKNGLQLNSAYDKNDPTTWAGTCWEKCEGDVYYLCDIMLNKQMLSGAWGYIVPAGDFCLGGALDMHGMTRLYSVWSAYNKFTYADFTDCPRLITVWNRYDTYNGDVRLHGSNNLISLSLTGCDIKEVDLFGLKSLWALNLSYTDISHIDFSDCKDTVFDISLKYCKLSQIDVSELRNLFSLNIENNYITEIDLTHNPELGWILCSNNKIGILDVSHNTKLGNLTANNCDLRSVSLPMGEYGYERQIFLAGNKLTEIDLSGVTGLSFFDCDNNYIKELDVSDCPYLVAFSANNNLIEKVTFGANPSLGYIRIANNRLTELKIPKESVLFHMLMCSNNFITELDLSGFNCINELDCHNNNIKHLDLHTQAGTFEKADSFHVFDCSGNPIEELSNVPFAKTRQAEGRYDLYSEGGGYAVTRSEYDIVYEPTTRVTYRLYIAAEPAEGCNFLGWYDGDICVSTENDILVSTIKGTGEASVVESDFNYTYLMARFSGEKPQGYTGKYETTEDAHEPTQNIITEGCTFDENDVSIVHDFLEQKDESGKKNGEKLMSAYDAEKPETWTCCFWVEREGVANLEALFLDNQLDNNTGKYAAEDRYTLTGTLNMAGAEHLSYVYLYGSEITSVDFTGCSSLTHLYAGNNGMLSHVKLSGCDKLISLDLNNCNINVLDLSEKSSLYYLNVNNNLLERIDLSQIPSISCLKCANNSLTELDTENAPNLYSLYCQNNKIKELSVWMCTYLGRLNCSCNGMTKLETIQGKEYEGKYAHMESMHCEGNDLTSVYIVPTILVCHANNNRIETVNNQNKPKDGNLMYLYISHNNLDTLAFETEIYLILLDCSYNELEALSFLQQYQLTVLDCSHNRLEKNALPTGYEQQIRVMYYDCSFNNIPEVDLKKCGCNMYYLNISDNPVVSIKNAPLGYILRQPITLGDARFYRINIKTQGTGYIDYDLDTITAIGDDFTGFYSDGTKLTAEKTLPTDELESCTITAMFGKIQLGDVNMDGIVNTGDAVVILKHSAEMIQLSDEQKVLADCNHDGNVNTGDAVLILKYAAGMITSTPSTARVSFYSPSCHHLHRRSRGAFRKMSHGGTESVSRTASSLSVTVIFSDTIKERMVHLLSTRNRQRLFASYMRDFLQVSHRRQ